MSTQITTISSTTITDAVRLLQNGKLVVFPTETIYALAGDAASDSVATAIYAAKGRNPQQPLSLLVGSLADAEKLAVFTPYARELAERFWPGPLTLVATLREPSRISPLVHSGTSTIGIRIPHHPTALAILEQFGGPLIGTSVNRSGEPSATTAHTASSALGDHVAQILDGGASPLGMASTVVDVTGAEPKMLRQGSVHL